MVAPPTRPTDNVICLDRHGDVTLEIYGLHPKLIDILLSRNLHVNTMTNLPSLFGESNEESDPHDRSIRFLLSSTHLMLGSTYFAALLRSMEQESRRRRKHHRFQHRTRSNGIAFVYMLALLHCRNHVVPHAVPYSTLSDMAILVNYYGCYEAVKSIADTWINGLLYNFLPNPPADLHLRWVMIAWVFRRGDIFSNLTRDVITMSTDKVDMGSSLPIPHTVLDKLNSAREYHLGILIQLLNTIPADIARGCRKEHEKFGDFIWTIEGCECTDTVANACNAEMASMGVNPPPTEPNFTGLSIYNLLLQCQKLKVNEGPEYGWLGDHRKCALWWRVAAALDRFQMPVGLDMNEQELEIYLPISLV